MAGAPECMVNDGQSSVFVGTFLADGTSINVCEEHFEGFLISTLSTVTNKPVAALLASAPEIEDRAQPSPDSFEEEEEFERWLEANRAQIEELVTDDFTFEQAVQLVLETQATDDITTSGSTEPTN